MGPSGDPGKLAVEPVSSNASQVSRVSSSSFIASHLNRTVSSRYFDRFPPRRAYNGVTSSAWKSTTAKHEDPRPDESGIVEREDDGCASEFEQGRHRQQAAAERPRHAANRLVFVMRAILNVIFAS